MLSFSEVVYRALNGPICTERDFDLDIFVPNLRKVLKKYDIKYDPQSPAATRKIRPRPGARVAGRVQSRKKSMLSISSGLTLKTPCPTALRRRPSPTSMACRYRQAAPQPLRAQSGPSN